MSTPISVYVDSPALTLTPVREALTPALPSPNPCGWCTTTRMPSRRLRRWLDGRRVAGAERVVAAHRDAAVPAHGGRRAPPACSSSTGRCAGSAFTNATPTTSEATARTTGKQRRCATREHDEPEREREVRGPRMRPEKAGVGDDRRGDRPPRPPPGDEEEQDDHEHVRGRERAEEGRDEPPDRVVLVARVEDPVLRQPAEPLVDEPELLLEPARHARVAPPLQRHEVDVGEAPERERRPRRRRAASESRRQATGVEHEQPAEEVRGDRDQVVARGEELAALRRLAVEPALREEPVEEDERRVDEREPVGPGLDRQRARAEERDARARRRAARPSRRRRRRARCRARLRPTARP